jgi:hypothetical protein
MPARTRSGHPSSLRCRCSFQILGRPLSSELCLGISISVTFPEKDLGWQYVSTPDRLNVYPLAPRDDPSAHRPLVDPTIRGVRFEEPRRQVKQHPQPRTEATSSSVVSQNHSFRQHNPLKNAAATPPELDLRCNRPCPLNPGRTGINMLRRPSRRHTYGHCGANCGAPPLMQLGGRSSNLCIGSR